jgi:hypothetical protein
MHIRFPMKRSRQDFVLLWIGSLKSIQPLLGKNQSTPQKDVALDRPPGLCTHSSSAQGVSTLTPTAKPLQVFGSGGRKMFVTEFFLDRSLELTTTVNV